MLWREVLLLLKVGVLAVERLRRELRNLRPLRCGSDLRASILVGTAIRGW